MPTFNFTVNGTPHTVDTPGDTPLLWVLRDLLGLTGTKYACGRGFCGACVVHLNGEATRSCVVPASAAADQEIVTIEGLSDDGTHPLQLAWDELNVSQCGYCQAGQIMNAAASIRDNPAPTMEDIDAFQSGNLCRCGTYPRIRAAIMRAAALART